MLSGFFTLPSSLNWIFLDGFDLSKQNYAILFGLNDFLVPKDNIHWLKSNQSICFVAPRHRHVCTGYVKSLHRHAYAWERQSI